MSTECFTKQVFCYIETHQLAIALLYPFAEVPLVATISRMSKSKDEKQKPKAASEQVRIKTVFTELLEVLAKRRVTSVPEEANRACRELLEREGLWPPRE